MDFGDILSQWNEQQKTAASKKKNQPQVSHKKPNALTKEEREALKGRPSPENIMESQSKVKINPMELWLRRYGTMDKDAAADEYQLRSKMESREYLRNMRPDARIDLHGLTGDQAWSRLETFVTDCIHRGYKKILIVHGKGNHSHGSDPVLGPMVKKFIEQHVNLGTSGHPDRNHGGTGATWVIIK